MIALKYEGIDFKYDNSFLKLQPKNNSIKAFLVPKLGIFILTRNFPIRQTWGRWLQMWQYFFKITKQSTQIQKFLL